MRNLKNFIEKTNTAFENFENAVYGCPWNDEAFASISEPAFLGIFEDVFMNREIVNESEPDILDCVSDAMNGREVDEGVLAGVLGGVLGLTAGPAIGKAICKALNIQKGALYDLLTSRLVTTAIATKLGLRA